MSHNPAIELAETIQTASIKRHPSPTHDLNPSTAASKKEPVTLESASETASETASIASDLVSDHHTLKARPRRAQLPPLPDLRFEQSYLASLKGETRWSIIAYITIRDQVFMPLLQGTLWTLAVAGWRHWNKGAKFQGRTLGSRIRRWWWEVNNWKIPQDRGVNNTRLAGQVQDYYTTQFSSAAGD